MKDIIDKSIEMLSKLDECFENLEVNDIEKINILTKSKELVFWLTYYKDEYLEDEYLD